MRWVFALLLSFGTIIAAYLLWQGWYEDSELIFATFITGVLGFHYGDFYYMTALGLNQLYVYLYEVFPLVAVYPLVYYLLLGIAGTVLLSFTALVSNGSLRAAWVVTVIFVGIIPSAVRVQDIRLASLLTLSSLLLIGKVRNGNIGTYLFGILLYGIAALTRIEACLALSAVAGLFLLNTGRLKQQATLLIAPFCMALAVTLYLAWQINYSPLYHWQIEPDLEYLILEKHQIKPLAAMTTDADSLRYIAATSWFIADSVNLPPSFLENLVVPSVRFFLQPQIIYQQLKVFAFESPQSILLLCGLISLLFYHTLFWQQSRFRFLTIAALLLLVLFPSLTTKTVSRVLEPFLFCIFLVGIALVPVYYKRYYSQFLLVLAFIASGISVAVVNKASTEQNANYFKAQQALNSISQKYSGYRVIIGDLQLFTHPVLSPKPVSNLSFVPLEVAQVTYVPLMRTKLAEFFPECDFYDFGCRARSFSNKPTIILADEQRLNLLRQWLQKFYNVRMPLENGVNLAPYSSLKVFKVVE